MSGPEIRSMLVLSTKYLPGPFFIEELRGERHEVTGWFNWEHGALLWVPDAPDEVKDSGFGGDVHAAIVAIRAYARSHGCDYVMFDSDGGEAEASAGLRTYDWSDEENMEETQDDEDTDEDVCAGCGAQYVVADGHTCPDAVVSP